MLTLSMPPDDKDRAYRRRLAAKGRRQLIVALPRETVALIDAIKTRQGLRSRSQALLKLIENGRAARPANDLKCKSPPCRAGFCKTRDGPYGWRRRT